MNILGYSCHINTKNEEKIDSLNESIKNETNEILSSFESIEFSIEGSIEHKDLKLMVSYKTKTAKAGIVCFTSHVDEGAISINGDYIQAYYGIEKYNLIKDILDDHGGILEAEYLQSHEPELYNQLATEYLLLYGPDTIGGGEFTKEDEKFFKELL